jgi:pyrimidine operon attenuation protein/uracil phosphoribosyltransferase
LNTSKSPHYDTPQLLENLQEKLQQLINARRLEAPIMIGIHTGGAWIAERLHRNMALTTPLALLDISFYRDDFTRIGVNPEVKPSRIPTSIDDRHIILIDDVLHTGRTIRAAMNELFDYGRPASIHLGVLVDRSGRELPIQADVSALQIDLASAQHIKLQGPEPLELTVIDGQNG